MRILLLLTTTAMLAGAADFHTPAGTRQASTAPQATVLPGGRLLTPAGLHHFVGPGAFGLAISPDEKTVVSSDGGPNQFSLTILRNGQARQLRARKKDDPGDDPDDDWRSVFMGLAFAGDTTLFASEGNSGRVRLVDLQTGKRLNRYDLNTGGFHDSYTGDLAFDAARAILYVLDQANFRVAAIDTRTGEVISSLRVGRLPFSLALSPDARRLYITNIGMFEYKPLAGADPSRPGTGVPFPVFGFPSRESLHGTASASALGSPNSLESNSLAAVDATTPQALSLLKQISTGLPFGKGTQGGSSPAGVAATPDRIYVTNSHNDSVSVIDARTLHREHDILIRIPGLERFRGVMPIGIAYDSASRQLLVAEAGINAVGIINAQTGTVTGHLPAAWFPTRIAIAGGRYYVACAKGFGTGPNSDRARPFQADFRRGVVLSALLPGGSIDSTPVYANNGFTPTVEASPALPAALRNVVIIVKENRTFDEVFGDIGGQPQLARFGKSVTPNHHEVARRWAMSDNFYADSEVSVDGHHWLVGSYPDPWTESTLMAAYGGEKDFRMPTTAPGRLIFAQSNSSVHPEEQPEAGTLWHHLERHKIAFRNFGEGFELAGVNEGPNLKPTGARYFTNVPMPEPLFRNTSRNYAQFNTNIPDQYRATQLITELKTVRQLPRLLFIHLPNDHTAKVRPRDGYPTAASYVADNDYALGRILEYLSNRPEWKSTAVFITEDDSQSGVDHVDSHRTVLLIASPFARRNYVSHANTSFPGLLKTVFRILGLPPLNLYDAAATDLSDAFQPEADFTPYHLEAIDPAVFDPAKARESKDSTPSVRMDDPRFIRAQQRK